MEKGKKKRIIHELKYFEDFDKPTPDMFHKIYYKLTQPYLKGKKVLNVGCWTGNYETMFKDDDCSVVGLDISLSALRTAKKANPHCKFLAADAFSMPLKDKSFDAVTLFMVLEHFPKDTESLVLKEINRVLKDEGLLIITTPHYELIGNILDVARWLVGHRHYKVGLLKELLNKCSFQVERLLLKGRFWSNFSIPFFYLFKYLCRVNIYRLGFVERILKAEYSKDGYRDIFLVCRKRTKREN